MSSSQENLLLIIVGCLLITIPIVKSTLERAGIPALVGFVGLGLACRLIDLQFPFTSPDLTRTVNFLADIGIVILLFQLGLKSNIKELVKNCPMPVSSTSIAVSLVIWQEKGAAGDQHDTESGNFDGR